MDDKKLLHVIKSILKKGDRVEIIPSPNGPKIYRLRQEKIFDKNEEVCYNTNK